MKYFMGSAAAAALIGMVVAELPPIHVKGSKFFYKNGTQFFMKGVAYQAEINTQSTNEAAGSGPQKFIDPLADIESCTRDVPYLADLGTNTIRVYAIDPKADQDECMQLLDEAGIYVIADLSQPGESVNRDSPAWDDVLYARYTSVVDKMAKYPNTLGFFAGNEVTNNVTNTNASPFVKAAVRDMKAYIKEKGHRTIPVGYATNDDADVRLNLAAYFNCGPAEESVDFWGYNIYSWCGESSFTESGFDKRTKEFENYNVPVFFAEYGCNEVQPRPFTEVGTLYGEEMTPVWSGGIVYMYFQEPNNYGLAKVDSKGNVETLEDYDNLKDQIASVDPSPTQESSYKATSAAAQECPTVGDDWNAASNLPPTPDKDLCACMVKSLECVVAKNVKATAYGELFGFICGPDALGKEGCEGIASDGETGTYGSYSMCSASEKVSWALNAYAKANNGECDFEGQATTQTASSGDSCAKKVESAGGVQGTTVSSSSSSGSGSKSSKSAAYPLTVPSVNMALVNMGIAVTIAFFGGVGLVVM